MVLNKKQRGESESNSDGAEQLAIACDIIGVRSRLKEEPRQKDCHNFIDTSDGTSSN